MASFSGRTLAKSFAIDRNEAQETARRQFTISAVILFALLFAAIVAISRQAEGRAPIRLGAAAPKGDFASQPIKTSVRYAERSKSTHKIAVASNAD